MPRSQPSEKAVRFSQPILNGGLQIMVPRGHHGESSGPGLQAFLDLLFSKMMLVWLRRSSSGSTPVPAHINVVQRAAPQSR